MAIDTRETVSRETSGMSPSDVSLRAARIRRVPGWLRPNLLWALAGFVIGYVVGFWAGTSSRGPIPLL
jgi:uncharacterized protein YfiM (DUF2279 family)